VAIHCYLGAKRARDETAVEMEPKYEPMDDEQEQSDMRAKQLKNDEEAPENSDTKKDNKTEEAPENSGTTPGSGSGSVKAAKA
jgi:hypothetical protein